MPFLSTEMKKRYPPRMASPTPSVQSLRRELRSLATEQRRRISQSFFKTGKGEYGEGDIFLGITMPDIRKAIRPYHLLSVSDILSLLHSTYHEERMAALLILVAQFSAGNAKQQECIYTTYLRETRWINNWDLVDASAPSIVGAYLHSRKRDVLERLAHSSQLWERRISIVATYAFIRHGDFPSTLQISRLLLTDKEDLIQKATGWMLREIGKRDLTPLRAFLDAHAAQMPRTMLRYAIERLDPDERRNYLARG